MGPGLNWEMSPHCASLSPPARKDRVPGAPVLGYFRAFPPGKGRIDAWLCSGFDAVFDDTPKGATWGLRPGVTADCPIPYAILEKACSKGLS
jgi:hypothetical protein